MSTYLVIARKWRPALFDEIVGQEHVTRTLKNAISSGRVAHAYLFSGPRGVGKTTAARILARGLNCASGPTPTPCNNCTACKGIASGSSVDVFEIDGASNNGVENVRELTDSIRYVPSEGRYKVYIIDEVHMLSGAAFNALLKTLEEPPPHAVFIFATTEVHKIPATILSRCQRFDFRRIPYRDIQRHLASILVKEGVKFDQNALFTIAREADGSLRDAQSLLDQVLAFSGGAVTDAHVSDALGLMDRSVLFDLLEAVAGKDGKAVLNIVEKIHDFGYDLKRASGDILEHIRDVTFLKVIGDGVLEELSDSECERLGRLAASVGMERLHMLFSIMTRGYEEIARSAYPRYSLEMALLKAAHFDEVQPVAELVERLEKLLNNQGVAAAAQRPVPARAQQAPPVHAQSKPVTPSGAPAAAQTGAAEEAADYSPAQEAAQPDGTGASDGFADFLRQKIPSSSEHLKTTEIRRCGDVLEITTTQDNFIYFDKIKREQIAGTAEEFYKKRLRLEIKSSACGTEKKSAVDPVLKDAVKILGGKVIEELRRTNV